MVGERWHDHHNCPRIKVNLVYRVLESVAGAQEKANAALLAAKKYTDQATSIGIVAGLTADSPGAATDNTAIINQAIEDARLTMAATSPNIRGKTVMIPSGNYYINDTLTIRRVIGLTLCGVGGQTALIWLGDDETNPIILMSNTRMSSVTDMIMRVDSSCYSAIQCRSDDSDDRNAHKNNIKNIFVDSAGDCLYGIVFGGAGSVDYNNDFNYCENVSLTGYQEAGFLITGGQTYSNLLLNSNASSYQDAKYGVYGSAIGSVKWVGGGFNGHSIADIAIGRSGQPCVFESFSSENSKHLLELISEAYHHVSLKDFRFAANEKPEGGSVVIGHDNMQCLLEMSGARICTNSGFPTPAYTIDIDIDATSYFKFDGNEMFSSAVDVFPNSHPTVGDGNNVQILDESTRERQKLTW